MSGLQRRPHRRSPGTYLLGQPEVYLGRRVRPLPVLPRFMADDVSEPPARPDLKTSRSAIPELVLARSGFPLDGEEINKQI